jgi:hypothetical protein
MRTWVVLVYVIFALTAQHARAEPSATEASALTAQIDAGLVVQRRRSRAWLWSWLTLYAGACVSSTVMAVAAHERVDRDLQVVSAVSAGIGIVGLVTPPLPRSGLLQKPIDGESAEPGADLATRRDALKRVAEQEAFLRGVWAHVGNVVVGAGSGLYLGLRGADVLTIALPTAAVSMAVGLIQIVTTPRYGAALQRKFVAEPARARLRIVPLVAPTSLGMRVAF